MSYAWIIDTDHLAEPGGERGTNTNAVTITGPREAPDWMADLLGRPKVGWSLLEHFGAQIFTFQMRDDDGELYYTGRMITDEGTTEEACYGPLGDYGMPNAGCTDIRYPGHPDMDCG